MIKVEKSQTLRVMARELADRSHRRVLLSFTGVGHQMGGMDAQRPEFFSAGNAFDNILFISDLTRSWGNRIDFDLLCDRLAPFTEGREVYTLGNSMGGFLAILIAQHLPVTACAAFAPQFSVCPSIVPEETRWQDYISQIEHWSVPSLEDRFTTTTRYCVFSGDGKIEAIHAQRFPVLPNLSHVMIPGTNHALAKTLKDMGVLREVISMVWNDSFSPKQLSELTGMQVHTLSPTAPRGLLRQLLRR